MKKFLKRTALFSILPLTVAIAGFFWIEHYLEHYPSTIQLKAKFMNAHKASIQTLVLGSSHHQNAIDPSLFPDSTCANLAFGGQDFLLDSLLFYHYLEDCRNLKQVVFELSYHSLEHYNSKDYHRNVLYYRYYGINNFGHEPNLLERSIFLSKKEIYAQFLNPMNDVPPTNNFGFTTALSNMDKAAHRFKDMKFDEAKIKADTGNVFIKRHRKENLKAFKQNVITLENMIAVCEKQNIEPIIVMPPVYKTYYAAMLPKKNERRMKYIATLSKKYPSLRVYDFEQHPDFNVRDFKNEDHLNPEGAQKFSELLQKTLSHGAH